MQNALTLAIVAVRTAENEPAKVLNIENTCTTRGRQSLAAAATDSLAYVRKKPYQKLCSVCAFLSTSKLSQFG